MTQRSLIAIILLLVLLGGLGYYLSRHIEPYTAQINTGPTVEAIFNPWLAAQDYLKKHDIESHRSLDLNSILQQLKPDDTLVVFNDTPIYNTHTQQQLMDWMRAGGHLILSANYEWNEEQKSSGDPFLDSFGVHMIWTGPKDEDENTDADSTTDADQADSQPETQSSDNNAEPDAGSNTDTQDDAKAPADSNQDNARDDSSDDKKIVLSPECPIYTEDKVFLVNTKQFKQPLQINFGYTYTLDDASGKSSGSSQRSPNGVLQYDIGKGLMTVLLDTDIWSNHNIGDYDHAFLLWYLVGSSPKVWLVASNDSDNVVTLLWRSAPYLIIGLISLLLAWGWRRWVRFGPLLPDPSPNRRQLLEHIDADALFSWQHGQLEPRLKSVRDQIWLRLSQQHGIHNHNPELLEAALAKLADVSQQPLETVRTAMTCSVPPRELQWVELISQLQTIRNAL